MSDILIPNLPATQAQLQRKYTTLAPQLAQFPTGLTSALQTYDTQRANRGAPPLSTADTARVLATALQNRAITPPPTHNSILDLPGNFVSDLRSVTSSIPKLPMALYHEITSLPQLPGAISSALAQPGIGNEISALTQAPGIRMIPGAYTLGNIFGGHPGNLIQHPLMSALDILPLAHEVSPAIKSAFADTAIGQSINEGAQALSHRLALTRPGQFATEMLGPESRQLAIMESQANRTLGEEFRPGSQFHGAPTTLATSAASDPLVQAARDADALRTTFQSIPDARKVELAGIMEHTIDPTTVPPLTDVERGYIGQYQTISDAFARHATQEGFVNSIDGEIYDNVTARKLLNIRQQRDTTIAVNEARNLVMNPPDPTNPATPDALAQLQAKYDSVSASTSMTKGMKQKLLRGYDLAMDAAQNPTIPTEQIIADLLPRSRVDPTVARLIETIRSEDWSSANKLTRLLDKRVGPGQLEDLQPALDAIRRQSANTKYLSSTSNFSDAAATRLAKLHDKFVTDNPPGRFLPAIQAEARNRVLAKYTADPNFPTILQYVNDGYYKGIPSLAEDYSKNLRDVQSTWQDMRDAGVNPVFIHHVSPTAARAIDFPRVFESIRSPTQARARTRDLTPYVQDPSVGLSHQGLELLRRRQTENFVDQLTSTWGRTSSQLMEDYLPQARNLAAGEPRISATGQAERLINKEWTKYDPNSIITWSGAKINNLGGEDIYLPKAIAKNVERMHQITSSPLSAVMDPIMKAFRTSVLALAPRWFFHTIFGGGMMAAAEDPMILGMLGKARELIKTGETDIHGMSIARPTELPSGMVSMPNDVLNWDKNPANEFHFRGGTTMARLWNSLGPVRDTMGNLVDRSYAAHGFFYDMYRSAAYLRGVDKSLTAGLTLDEARATGLQLARKILQNWDTMTPLERTVLRSVYPFYGWTQHILKYAYNYPFDHPLRVSILGSFARNEVNDMGTGLPDKFLSSFFLGHPDAKGNVRSIETSVINPFRDVANYATLAGFTSGLNPVLATVLQKLGVDTSKGAPELYPSLQYDPDTGRLAAHTPGILSTLLGNIVPQSQVLLGLFGASSEFKQLLRTNPDAASRLLRSQAGLPIIFKNVPLYQEEFKAEQARNAAQSQALAAGLKSGDLSNAATFPGLTALLQQVKTLQAQGKLAKYTPPSNTPSNSALAQQAFITENVP